MYVFVCVCVHVCVCVCVCVCVRVCRHVPVCAIVVGVPVNHSWLAACVGHGCYADQLCCYYHYVAVIGLFVHHSQRCVCGGGREGGRGLICSH